MIKKVICRGYVNNLIYLGLLATIFFSLSDRMDLVVYDKGLENVNISHISVENINSHIENTRNQGNTYMHCTQWGVVITKVKPSKVIKLVSQLAGWCLVVVADSTTPKNFMAKLNYHKRTVYLGTEQQASMGIAFVGKVPWDSYSRKNIGYLYAIQHGAEVILDFDDDTEIFQNENSGRIIPPDFKIDIARLISHDRPTYS